MLVRASTLEKVLIFVVAAVSSPSATTVLTVGMSPAVAGGRESAYQLCHRFNRLEVRSNRGFCDSGGFPFLPVLPRRLQQAFASPVKGAGARSGCWQVRVCSVRRLVVVVRSAASHDAGKWQVRQALRRSSSGTASLR